MSHVAVLGAGSWGSALAKVLAEKGDHVHLWARRADLVDEINTTRVNSKYLPGARFADTLRATTDLGEAVGKAEMVVFVAPSHATREVARQAAPLIPRHAMVVSATKGIENESLQFIDEVLASELPGELHERFAFLSGPSFAKELSLHLPTGVVIASKNVDVRDRVMRAFHTPYLRVYGSEDIVGVECGGAMKNVIAIAAGTIEGMGLGHNTRAILITRGLAEIARLAVARGGNPLTLAGLSGMGDLVLTCTGELSRNRTVGVELGKGRRLGEILASLGHVAEGVKTTKSAYDLSRKLNVEMPITREVYTVLYEDKPVHEAAKTLMSRDLTPEFDFLNH